MTIQKTPNGWSCLLVAFAIAINEPYEDLIKEIGHDGSRKIWSHLPEPYCRQSFHPQELIDCCFNRNIHILEIEKYPCLKPIYFNPDMFYVFDDQKSLSRFNKYIQTFPGVLIGSTHAVAWDGLQLYDPKGYTIPNFDAQHFFGIVK